MVYLHHSSQKKKYVPLPLCIPTFFWERGRQPGSGEQQVREHLEKLGIFRLMELDGNYWGVLARSGRCEATVCHLQKNCAAVRGPQWMKKGSHYPCLWERKKKKKKHLCNYRLTTFTSGPGKIMEYILIPRHMKDKKAVRNGLDSPYCCLEWNDLLQGWGRAAETWFLVFSRAFGIVLNRGFVWKLTKNMLDKWTFRWIKNWLHH